MSIPFSFTYNEELHKARLEAASTPAEKVVSIAGRNYKILGNEEDVSLLRSHIAHLKTADFEDLNAFEASLTAIGPHEKTETVSQKTMGGSTGAEEIGSGKMEGVGTKKSFNISSVVLKVCDLIGSYYIFPDKADEGIQKIRERLEKGRYDTIKDADTFSKVFTKELHEVMKDKHFDILIFLYFL